MRDRFLEFFEELNVPRLYGISAMGSFFTLDHLDNPKNTGQEGPLEVEVFPWLLTARNHGCKKEVLIPSLQMVQHIFCTVSTSLNDSDFERHSIKEALNVSVARCPI
jgi:hypothetical protein